MHMIRQPDVDGVDLVAAQTFGILLVGIGVLNFIFPRKLFEFLGVAGDEGGKFGIFLGVSESRKHCYLRYVTESDDSITDFLAWFGAVDLLHRLLHRSLRTTQIVPSAHQTVDTVKGVLFPAT